MNSTSFLAPWYLSFSVLQNPVFFFLHWEVLPLMGLGTDTFFCLTCCLTRAWTANLVISVIKCRQSKYLAS